MAYIIKMEYPESVRTLGHRLGQLGDNLIGAQAEISRAARGMDWDGSGKDSFVQDVETWAGTMRSLSTRCGDQSYAVIKEGEEWEAVAAKFGFGLEGYTPFLIGDNENSGPDKSDIDQEGIGDCYLLSSLGSIAQNHPEVIQDMIEVLPGGKCRVRFYDKVCKTIFGPCEYQEHWVTVDMDFPRGHSLPADKSGGSQEVWTLIIEKAYLQWQKENGGDPFLDREFPAVALSAITGKNSVNYPLRC